MALQALVAQQDATLKDVRHEVATLLGKPDAVNRLPELRREEAQSLPARFPEIQVSDTSTAQQFVSALRQEERRLSKAKEDTLWAISVALRTRTCTALKNVMQTARNLEESPDWKLMTLEERTAVRAAVEENRSQATADGDPCQPSARPVIDDNMLGK